MFDRVSGLEDLGPSTEAGLLSESQGVGSRASVAIQPGDVIDHYLVKRQLGAGAMGEVYLARDTHLARLVALKLIRRERLGSVDSLIEEARITARLSHPNVVVVHDVGTCRAGPYVALEYVEGETLAQLLARRRLAVPEVLRIARQIAGALAHAHGEGVLHRDLKPANVLLARDGRVRVVDFGLAVARDAVLERAAIRAGTPAYMAPEQWSGEGVSPASDVWALGLLLFEMLVGRRPERGVSPPALDESLARVDITRPAAALVMSCLASMGVVRPSASEVERALDRLLSPGRAWDDEDGPYRGLLPFQERHSGAFFGRDGELAMFMEGMRTNTLLPVVGPSGAGKSSFVHAGVVPRVRERQPCTVIGLRPGRRPLEALARRLVRTGNRSDDVGGGHAQHIGDTGVDAGVDALVAALRQTPGALQLRLHALAAETSTHVLLVVDQLEELYSETEDGAERRQFIELILRAADDPDEPIRVIVTLRDDFLGRLPELTNGRQLTVLRPLGADDLRRTVLGPLEGTGVRFEDDALVDTLLEEARAQSVALPLLQFCCQRLWDESDKRLRVLTRAAYARFGGLVGALTEHADSVIDGLAEDRRAVARTLLLALVGHDRTRRSVDKVVLESAHGPLASAVLDRLIQARLVLVSGGRDRPSPAVELVHESLIVRWSRLARWLDEGREQHALLLEVEDAAALWDRRGRRVDETWDAAAVHEARRRLGPLVHGAPPIVETFLATSEARARQRRLRRRWLAGGAVAALMAIAVGATAIAYAFAEKERQTRQQASELVLATADVGVFELELMPFAWDGAEVRHLPRASVPELSWALHAPDPNDPERPGVALTHVTASPPDAQGVQRVEARSGRAFLRIDGRGTDPRRCGPAWLALRALPGYGARANVRRMRVPVPTCAATFDGMVEIPAGTYVSGGLGEPEMARPQLARPEVVRALPTFSIDAQEVSNARFAVFGGLSELTGVRGPGYPSTELLSLAARPDHPVSGIDAATAAAYCLYLGKRLPDTEEWEKAARGGHQLDAAGTNINPHPRRAFPWVGARDAVVVNIDSPSDGYRATAPVDAFPAARSPYGLWNMAGNVDEWTSTPSALGGGTRVVRGGSWNSPVAMEHYGVSAENARDPRYFDFSLGARCVYEGSR